MEMSAKTIRDSKVTQMDSSRIRELLADKWLFMVEKKSKGVWKY